MFLNLYKSLIRPISMVMLSGVLTCPQPTTAIEKVQHKATKLYSPLIKTSISYTNRLTPLKLPSGGDMILMYKIVNGLAGIDMNIFTFTDAFPYTTGHRYKLYKYPWPVHYNTRANFFSCRIIMWNSLPSDVVEAPTIIAFKSHLDSHWNNFIYI